MKPKWSPTNDIINFPIHFCVFAYRSVLIEYSIRATLAFSISTSMTARIVHNTLHTFDNSPNCAAHLNTFDHIISYDSKKNYMERSCISICAVV